MTYPLLAIALAVSNTEEALVALVALLTEKSDAHNDALWAAARVDNADETDAAVAYLTSLYDTANDDPYADELEAARLELAKIRNARLEELAAKADAETAANKCPKCQGKGRLTGYEHVEGGRCFKCGGDGKTGTNTAANDAFDAYYDECGGWTNAKIVENNL